MRCRLPPCGVGFPEAAESFPDADVSNESLDVLSQIRPGDGDDDDAGCSLLCSTLVSDFDLLALLSVFVSYLKS